MARNKQTGSLGEKIAERYLEKRGYKVLAKNWQNKWGEIDIVAEKNKVIHFVEVKTLHSAQAKPFRSASPGPAWDKQGEAFLPEDEIGQKKKKQLLKMAQIYLSANRLRLNTPCQIDILAVELKNGQTKIRHLENVIEDNG